MSFGNIPPLTPKAAPADPFEIFARRPSLPSTPNDLWGGQKEALQDWVKARKSRDVLISLNTGSGKTLLGVLIAQGMANEKQGKCVYVCSTIDLVKQTEKEAAKLGINPTTYTSSDFNNTDFEQGKTFCITTYAAVFNARTTFRKHGVNKFVLDDAHVAEKAIRDSFTLKIGRREHPELFKVVARLLLPVFTEAGQATKFREVMEQRDPGIMLVPPMLALQVAEKVSDEVRKLKLNEHRDLLYPYPYPYLYLQDHFKVCAITVSGWTIEVSPPFLPSSDTYPFSQDGMRRVYLSATLQTQAEFARAFGNKPDKIIAPETDAGNGERCIIFGQYVPDEDTGKKLVTAIKARHKIVIACSSYDDASEWKDLAVVPDRDLFSVALDKFKKDKVGAFVLVARVDGIDLPDDICHVMLIDDLPSGYSQLERFQIEYCSMTALAATKLASRITQVFGRINRGRADYGVFIVRGRNLNNWLNNTENTSLLPELLQKQLLLGDKLSDSMIRNKNAAAIVNILGKVLARDKEWIETYGNRIAEAEISADIKATAREKDNLLTDAAISEAAAMHAAWRNEYVEAAAALAETADKAAIADPRLAGWHNLWLGWFYQLAGDNDAAGAEYRRARSRLGTAIYLPQPASSIPGGERITERGKQIYSLVTDQHSSRFDKELSIIARRFESLGQPDASFSQHEEATRALGEALGFRATRPDSEFRTGPDVLWVDIEQKRALLFELKTQQAAKKQITKSATAQGHDHVQWVRDNHAGLQIVGVVFVADTKACFPDANPSTDMWVGPLSSIREVGDEFLSTIRAIRSALPIERPSRVNNFIADEQNSLDGVMERVAPHKLK